MKTLSRQRHDQIAHPEKAKARLTAYHALVVGPLAKRPCEVCHTDTDVEMHHDDYTDPLQVRWLCTQHHRKRDRYLAMTRAVESGGRVLNCRCGHMWAARPDKKTDRAKCPSCRRTFILRRSKMSREYLDARKAEMRVAWGILGEMVRNMRVAAGCTQSDLGRMLGYPDHCCGVDICRLEAGDCGVSRKKWNRIAEALGEWRLGIFHGRELPR